MTEGRGILPTDAPRGSLSFTLSSVPLVGSPWPVNLWGIRQPAIQEKQNWSLPPKQSAGQVPQTSSVTQELAVRIGHKQQRPARPCESRAGLTSLGELEEAIIHGDPGFDLSKTTESISSQDYMDVSCFHSHSAFGLWVEGRFEPVGGSNRKPSSSVWFKGLLTPLKTDSEPSPTSP